MLLSFRFDLFLLGLRVSISFSLYLNYSIVEWNVENIIKPSNASKLTGRNVEMSLNFLICA